MHSAIPVLVRRRDDGRRARRSRPSACAARSGGGCVAGIDARRPRPRVRPSRGIPLPTSFAQRPHGAAAGSSRSRVRYSIRQPSVGHVRRICTSSRLRVAMTRAIRSSSGFHGSAVRDHRPPVFATAPSSSSSFSAWSSWPRGHVDRPLEPPDRRRVDRLERREELAHPVGRRERGPQEVVGDLVVLAARQQDRRTLGRPRVRPGRPAGSRRSPSPAAGSGRRSRGRACRSPSRARRSRRAPSSRSRAARPRAPRGRLGHRRRCRRGRRCRGVCSHAATRSVSATVRQ